MDGKMILTKLSPYEQGKQTEEIKKEYGLERVIKLASNENPYGFSKKLKDNLNTIIHELHIYPDGYTRELRTALADKFSISKDQLIFGSGSDEIIQLICRAFLYPGANTIMATPTFPQYKHNALIEGATINEIPTIKGSHDLESMLQAIDNKTKVVWLCSPNNPTGISLLKESFYEFMDKCPKDVLVVLDEAYYEYMDKQLDLDAITHLQHYENLILLRTFSKVYGLAGLRIGYGITNTNIVKKLDVVRGPFNTSVVAQKAALIALDDKKFIEETVIKNQTVKQSFQTFLDKMGWDYYDSQTNFLLVKTPVSGTEVFQYLLENGFIVRPGELLGMPKTIRVTLGTERDMEWLQKSLYKLHLQISKEI